MSRITGSDALKMFEAYAEVYAPEEQELTEEQVGEIDENSDIQKTFKKGTEVATKALETGANYVRGGVDNAGSAVAGIVQGISGVDLNKVGRSAEKFLGGTGATVTQKPVKDEKPVKPVKDEKPVTPVRSNLGPQGLRIEGWGPFLTQKEKDEINAKMREGNKPKSTNTTVVAPRGQRLGTMEPGKPETWKASEDRELLKRYKEKRGATQLAKDKEEQSRARKDILKNADDEKKMRQINLDVEAGKRVSPTEANPTGDPRRASVGTPGREKALVHWTKSSAQPPAAPAPRPAAPVLSKQGGVEGTGVGKDFKAKAWSGAERQSYGSAAKVAPSKPSGESSMTPMRQWAAANPKLAAKVVSPPAAERVGTQMGTGQSEMSKQAKELRDMRAASQLRQQGATVTSDMIKNVSVEKPKPPIKASYEYDAYDLVLEYLLGNGHAETVDEAHYLMLEMDAQMVGNIIEVSDI